MVVSIGACRFIQYSSQQRDSYDYFFSNVEICDTKTTFYAMFGNVWIHIIFFPCTQHVTSSLHKYILGPSTICAFRRSSHRHRKKNKPIAGIGPKSVLHGVTLIRSVPLTLTKEKIQMKERKGTVIQSAQEKIRKANRQ